MRFLVVLDPSCSEERASVIRVISEFSLSRRLEVCVIATQLVMCIDLIEGVLVAEELILGEADIVPFGIEFVGLFCRKVLAITSRVVPMMMLQHILRFLIHYVPILQR